MSLYLTGPMRRSVDAAQRVMLAPLAYEDVQAWQFEVNRCIRDLVGADHIITFLTDERGLEYFSDDTDTDSLWLLDNLFSGYDAAGYATFEPHEDDPIGSHHIEQFHRYRRDNGSLALCDDGDAATTGPPPERRADRSGNSRAAQGPRLR